MMAQYVNTLHAAFVLRQKLNFRAAFSVPPVGIAVLQHPVGTSRWWFTTLSLPIHFSVGIRGSPFMKAYPNAAEKAK
jgi:hypothetical protein